MKWTVWIESQANYYGLARYLYLSRHSAPPFHSFCATKYNSAFSALCTNIRMKRLTTERYNNYIFASMRMKAVACNRTHTHTHTRRADRTAPTHLFRITHIKTVEIIQIVGNFFSIHNTMNLVLFHFFPLSFLRRHSYWHCCKQCVHGACVIGYAREKNGRRFFFVRFFFPIHARIDDDVEVSSESQSRTSNHMYAPNLQLSALGWSSKFSNYFIIVFTRYSLTWSMLLCGTTM